MTIPSLDSLISRLEALSGADREVDHKIMWELSDWRNLGGYWVEHKTTGERRHYDTCEFNAPSYTASFDAVLTLVPEDCTLIIQGRDDSWMAALDDLRVTKRWLEAQAFARSPALALCLACLRAMRDNRK